VTCGTGGWLDTGRQTEVWGHERGTVRRGRGVGGRPADGRADHQDVPGAGGPDAGRPRCADRVQRGAGVLRGAGAACPGGVVPGGGGPGPGGGGPDLGPQGGRGEGQVPEEGPGPGQAGGGGG